MFTPLFRVVVNAVFYLLCILGAVFRNANRIFGISVFGCFFANALLHIRGAVIQKG
ncbi:MAG: hypothetical protein JW929_15160 [Anaerolineales bacterium]|nr:hypothetical protein [Anaerolineales bacterium]